MVDLEFTTDPDVFLRAVESDLVRDPVLTTVVGTVTQRLSGEIAAGVQGEESVPRWWLVVRGEGGEVLGMGMRTAHFGPYPPYLLPMPAEAAVTLARVLYERGEEVLGLNGALPATRLCAEELARLTGGTAEVRQHSRLFELGELVAPRPPPGELRPAVEDDVERALDWYHAFTRDADEQAGRSPGAPHDLGEDRDTMGRRIAAGRLWFWEDETGEPVHLTGANPPAFGVARIGPVYTPQEHRARGYASAAVAEVSARIVADGSRACLFTDQANPTSNKIYEALGYRPVVDMANLVVTAGP